MRDQEQLPLEEDDDDVWLGPQPPQDLTEVKEELEADQEDDAAPGVADVEMVQEKDEGDLGQDILSQIMEMTMVEQLPTDLCKTMMRDLVKNQMFQEADALEAKWMELQHADSVQMMKCQNCDKKIDYGYTMRMVSSSTWTICTAN